MFSFLGDKRIKEIFFFNRCIFHLNISNLTLAFVLHATQFALASPMEIARRKRDRTDAKHHELRDFL
jgi:hypothetical protein